MTIICRRWNVSLFLLSQCRFCNNLAMDSNSWHIIFNFRVDAEGSKETIVASLNTHLGKCLQTHSTLFDISEDSQKMERQSYISVLESLDWIGDMV